MNRKLLYIILGVSAILVSAVLVFFLKFKSSTLTSPAATVQPTPIVYEEQETWKDPAQFSFQYPKTLSLNPHNEDEDNYAHVELTSATHSGNLIIWVKDTNVDTIEKWIDQEKLKNTIDTTLADVPAKKVLTTEETNTVTISAIQGGYLYQVEANLADADFWNQILEKVLLTFEFTPSETESRETPEAAIGGEQNVETLEEEVIE